MTGDTCNVPPAGWYCTRPSAHEGPCAALPIVEVEKPDDVVCSFDITEKQSTQARIWADKHDEKKHAKAMRTGHAGKRFRYTGAYTWEFTDTSIGTVIAYRCSCGEKIDVTNYNDW